MTTPHVPPNKSRFVLYVPSAHLSNFHLGSPWLMIPLSFEELGYDVTLVCGSYSPSQSASPVAVQALASSLKEERGWFRRVIVEPFRAFRVIWRKQPNLAMIGPMGPALSAVLPLVLASRLSIHARNRSIRFVLKVDADLTEPGRRGLSGTLMNLLLVFASHIFDLVAVESTCSADRARQLPGMGSRKVAVVGLGYPQGLLSTHPYDSQQRTPTILCVGRITPLKGQDVLLSAFAGLAAEFPSWRLRMVGPAEDPRFTSWLNRAVADLGLSGRVDICGFTPLPELSEEYLRASVFCLPSLKESAGQVSFEATACGLPVVTTDVPCGSDARDRGWLVARAGNVDSLREQLRILMGNPAQRSIASAKAQSELKSYRDIAQSYVNHLRGQPR